MRSLKEFIDYSNNYGVDNAILKEQYYNELCEFFDNNIPDYILEAYNNNEFVDYLYENLKTHDVKKLQEKLKQEYPEFEFENYEAGSFYIITNQIYKLKQDKEFLRLLEFYGYYLSYDNWTVGEKTGRLYVEPNETTDMTDYVYNDCHGICYHVCTEKIADSILKSDLRCKDAKYRKYPKRIFIFASPNGIKDDDFSTLVDNLKSPYSNDKQVALKINLNELGSKVKIKFMKDPAMHSKCALFTYNRIPKEIIKKVEL